MTFLRHLAMASIALMMACVTQPFNDQYVDADSVNFAGYAQNQTATIVVQGYDKLSGDWIDLDSTTASSSPTTIGSDTAYAWTLNGVDTDQACVWGDPSHACLGGSSALIRVVERGSSGDTNLTTFDDGGYDCVIDEMSSGTAWFMAGSMCASWESPILTLKRLI